MNRHLHTNLSMTEEQLKPQISNFKIVKNKEEGQRRKQKKVFDTRHAARDLDPFLPGRRGMGTGS